MIMLFEYREHLFLAGSNVLIRIAIHVLEKSVALSRNTSFPKVISIFLLLFIVILTTFFIGPSFGSNPRFPTSKPVLAYYYGWYTKNSWLGGIEGPSSLAVADVPSIGLYNSQNISVVDIQINEALSAGINGFIASWWGPNSFTDNTDKILIDEASKFSDFSVTLYFETEIIQKMNSSMTTEESQIVNDVSYIMQNYASNPAFTEVGGKQVLFFYGVDNWPLQFWANVTSSVHLNYPDLSLVSDSFNPAYLAVFDGASSYVDLGYMTQTLSLENGTYPTFLELSQLARNEGKLWFATASPGFNGTNAGKDQFPIVARDDGDTFTKGWDIAQNSNPDGIIVGTWNEFYEGTSIEPTNSYGTFYLQLTAQLSSTWRSPTPSFHKLLFENRFFPLETNLDTYL
jgi:hypothetical protein